MNEININTQEDRAALHQASIDSLLTVLRERADRIVDLESDAKTYHMLAAGALDTVVQLTKRNKQLATRIDQQADMIQMLLAAPCLKCRRRAIRDREPQPV